MEVINKIINYINCPNEYLQKAVKCVVEQTEKKGRSIRISAIFISNLIEMGHLRYENEIPQFLQEFITENISDKEVEKLNKIINTKGNSM